jgi:hypothetical protein
MFLQNEDELWDESHINIFFRWLYDCVLSIQLIKTEEFEYVYKVFKHEDEFYYKKLLSLTLYLFQNVLKKQTRLSLEHSELYGVICFGIALKYLSDTITGDVLLFLKGIIMKDKDVSMKILKLTEIEVLTLFKYKIPMNDSDLELSENLKAVLNLVQSNLE